MPWYWITGILYMFGLLEKTVVGVGMLIARIVGLFESGK
jgi:hypothetical protein